MRAVFCALQLGRMLLGRQHRAVCLERFSLQGLLVSQRKKGLIIYHGTCAAHFHSSFGVVVEWAMGMWWRGVVVGGWMHLNIAHVLSSMLVHMYSSLSFVSSCIFLRFLAHCMYRTCGSSLLVATSSFWDMAFPRV